MRNFLNAINGFPHAEERPEGASRSTHDRIPAIYFGRSQAGMTTRQFKDKRIGVEVGGQTTCEMRRASTWLWAVGFFGLLAAANAQTPSLPAATTHFDGTYALVSSTKMTEFS
jgi:hypothetical protein